MKIRLLLKVTRWIAKRYTKFNLFDYYPSSDTKYYGNFDYLEYFSSDKFPMKVVSTYSGYRTYDDIKKEYNHYIIRSMYSIIVWIRYKRYKYRVEYERKNIKKILK